MTGKIRQTTIQSLRELLAELIELNTVVTHGRTKRPTYAVRQLLIKEISQHIYGPYTCSKEFRNHVNLCIPV